MRISPILRADSYKASHFLQYPEDTEYVSSYIESRGSKFDSNNVLFFGLQMFLKEYMTDPVTTEDVNYAAERLAKHGLPFNRKGWQHIVDAHGGFAPVRIEALPEGTIIPTHNTLVQVTNTDPQCPWLTGHIETKLLRAVWYPTTVATLSALFKAAMVEALERTSDHPEAITFMLNDFGARGVSSAESAGLGGAGHLVNFLGTDNDESIEYVKEFYHEDMAGYSIPAAEHSTITIRGRDGEYGQIENMLNKFLAPGKMVAVVSDSYNLWNVVDNVFGVQLKERIMNSGGRVVVRPDSGNPLEIAPEVVERLMKNYGYTVNSKGFKVLPDCIRVIQGDGVSLQSVKAILAEMERRGLSVENIVFGCGGELLQKVNRDDLRFAQKGAATFYGGQWHDFFKDPETDPGKRSRAGRFAVVSENGDFETIRLEALGQRNNLLHRVYENGQLFNDQTFAAIRANANSGLWRMASPNILAA
jgi:nicotinamide phosphoribosyltransferase